MNFRSALASSILFLTLAGLSLPSPASAQGASQFERSCRSGGVGVRYIRLIFRGDHIPPLTSFEIEFSGVPSPPSVTMHPPLEEGDTTWNSDMLTGALAIGDQRPIIPEFDRRFSYEVSSGQRLPEGQKCIGVFIVSTKQTAYAIHLRGVHDGVAKFRSMKEGESDFSASNSLPTIPGDPDDGIVMVPHLLDVDVQILEQRNGEDHILFTLEDRSENNLGSETESSESGASYRALDAKCIDLLALRERKTECKDNFKRTDPYAGGPGGWERWANPCDERRPSSGLEARMIGSIRIDCTTELQNRPITQITKLFVCSKDCNEAVQEERGTR